MKLNDLVDAIPNEGKTAGLKSSAVKEVIRTVLLYLAGSEEKEVAKLLNKYRA